MATLDGILDCIADNFKSLDTTVLYNGAKTTSGNIQLSDDYLNYDLLAIYCKTNSDYFVHWFFLDNDLSVGQNITFSEITGTNSSWIVYAPVSNNKLYVSAQSSNVNWILGVLKVVGVKLAGKK